MQENAGRSLYRDVGDGHDQLQGRRPNFQISKNLDIFNSIFKELDMFYVDTVNAEK